jgi:hypothetical protein
MVRNRLRPAASLAAREQPQASIPHHQHHHHFSFPPPSWRAPLPRAKRAVKLRRRHYAPRTPSSTLPYPSSQPHVLDSSPRPPLPVSASPRTFPANHPQPQSPIGPCAASLPRVHPPLLYHAALATLAPPVCCKARFSCDCAAGPWRHHCSLALPCRPLAQPRVFGYMSPSATHCRTTTDPPTLAQLSPWQFQEHAKRSHRPCLLHVTSKTSGPVRTLAGNGVTPTAPRTPALGEAGSQPSDLARACMVHLAAVTRVRGSHRQTMS